jgi:hypothetical protein
LDQISRLLGQNKPKTSAVAIDGTSIIRGFLRDEISTFAREKEKEEKSSTIFRLGGSNSLNKEEGDIVNDNNRENSL